ncbi:Protein HSR-9, partial [Aphelenchoides avenae]
DEPVDAENGEDPEDPEEEDQDPKEEQPVPDEEEAKASRRTTRGSAASSALRTPTTRKAQSLPTPTASRKRGGAVDTPQPSSETRQQPKRQRRNSKESATPLKVEDLDLKPTGKTPTPRTKSPAKKAEPNAEADPYDFHNNANEHPNPMANIGSTQVQVQKQSPGDIRFSVTPKTGTSKYAHTERIASERRGEASTTPMSPLTAGKVTLSSVSLSTQSADKTISSPASTKKGTAARSSTVGTPRSRKSKVSESGTPSVLSADEYEGKSVGGSQSTPTSRRSTKSRAADPAVGGTPLTKKKMDVPEELSAEDQLNVDHPDEEHSMIPRGARVFGQYAQALYPAIICGADGLNRYSIYFIEDGLTKAVPKNGVFPLSKLLPGVTTMISPSPDDLSPNVVGREIEVVAVPDSKNGEEWKEGKFKVRDTETGEESTVLWTQFYFRKQDADALKLKETDTPLVKESNIVLEPKSSRRSRAALNQSSQSSAETPKTPVTTTPMARRGRQSTAKKEDLDKTQSSVDTAADADDAEQDQKSPVLSPSSGDGMKTPENAGPSVPIASARRSSTRGNRVKPSIFSGDADKKAVKFPEDLDEQTTPTSVTPAKGRTPRSAGRARGSRKSEPTADEQPQDSEAPEAAVDTTQESMDTTQPQDTAQEEEPASSKRGRGSRGGRKSSATTPAKSAKVAQVPTHVAQKNATEDEEPETEAQKVPQAIFQNRKFVLTSATRTNRAGQPQFNKREFRTLIEQRGGTVIDDFKGLGEHDEAYLIADTHYRTHKYLSALSLSVPCVHHTWITECIEQDAFVDFKDYMLAAGQALGPDGTIHEYEWKPQKGQLMAGKKVWIHSKNSSDPPVVGFVQLWSPIITAAGAEVVRDDDVPQNDLDLVQWISNGGIDIILTDPSCESLIVEAMEASESGEVVGSEWVIEALITGELPDTNNARYRHNA